MKLTENLIERIVTYVEESELPLGRIGGACGITHRTLLDWLREGEDYQQQLETDKIKESDLTGNEKLKLDLFLRVEVARTNVETKYLNKIRELAEKEEDICALQWLLLLKMSR